MNTTNLLKLSVAATLAGLPAAALASTVEIGSPGAGGVPYYWTVNLSGSSDLATFERHVGAWSWEDQSLFPVGGAPVGWTHNAEWVALRLDTAVVLTVRLERNAEVLWDVPTNEDPNKLAGNNLFPGLTFWSGWDTDGDSSHSFNNIGNVAWAEDLTYIGHQAPPTTGAPETRHMIETSFTLAPGDYTMVIGGNSESSVSEGRQGYLATFTTASVPEPGTAGLLLVGGLALLNRRRRR